MKDKTVILIAVRLNSKRLKKKALDPTLEVTIRVGKAGLTESLISELDTQLKSRKLVKTFRKLSGNVPYWLRTSVFEKVRPETGRVHTSLHVCAAVTGRMSASEPNLQQMPRKNEMGRIPCGATPWDPDVDYNPWKLPAPIPCDGGIPILRKRYY